MIKRIKMNKEELLELLKDPDIQDQILLILNRQQKVPQVQIESLEQSANPLQPSKDDFVSALKQEKAELDKAISELYKHMTNKSLEKEVNMSFIKQFFEWIKQIFIKKQSEIKEKDSTITQVTEKYNAAEQQLNSTKKQIQTEQVKAQELEQSLQNAQKNAQIAEQKAQQILQESQQLKSKFSKQIEMLNLYQTLSDSSKMSLKNVLNPQDENTFLLSGANKDHLDTLFEYIKNEIINDKLQDITKLKTLYSYFFEEFNKSTPKYEWQKIQLGARFNTDEQIKVGNASGSIEQVLLQGYVDAKTKKIIKKSVVKVN